MPWRKNFSLLVDWVVVVALGSPGIASAEAFIARLNGADEVPAVSTPATGQFFLNFSTSTNTGVYTLSYTGLQGAVTQAHIHIGQPGVLGAGTIVWLCGTPVLPGPDGTPTCPPRSGAVTGTIAAADVLGPSSQLIAPGELTELLRALRGGFAYVNVHTAELPNGEIRGIVR
jgi:hypothetical protein